MLSTVLLLLASFLACCQAANYQIGSATDFIAFANNVNGGTTYSGTTVLLTTDIDFTGKSVAPVGTSGDGFLGIFDGQGHTISNLKMSTSSQYVGVFGLSTGLTIKNVVVDDTCSFLGSSSTYADIGAIVGRITSNKGAASILNSVNMANVTYTGNSVNHIWLGGISGMFDTTVNPITVSNCVNYGALQTMERQPQPCLLEGLLERLMETTHTTVQTMGHSYKMGLPGLVSMWVELLARVGKPQ